MHTRSEKVEVVDGTGSSQSQEETMDTQDGLVVGAGRAAVAGGVLALVSLVTVLVGEVTKGADFMETTAAALAGWAGFVAGSLMVVGLLGVAVRYAAVLSGAGRAALLVLGFATAITVGASSTLALVVPALVDRLPEIVNDPPAAVPPTFIFSGLVMGICALVLAVGLRRAGAAPRGVIALLMVGAVLTMVPLPSRFFLLSFALGALALVPGERTARDASPVAGQPAVV